MSGGIHLVSIGDNPCPRPVSPVQSRCRPPHFRRRLGIYGLPKRRLPRGARVGKASSLDLVRRRFRADGPDRLWMTDVTEHPTREGKIYCCAVIDAFSRRVVGWSIDSRQTDLLVTNALGMA